MKNRQPVPTETRAVLSLAIISAAYLSGFAFSERVLKLIPFLKTVQDADLLLYTAPITAAFIFSSSYLGIALLPAAAVLVGALSYIPMRDAFVSFISGYGLMPERLGLLIPVLPVFIYISVRGMESSWILLTALCTGSSGLKKEYSKVYIPLMLTALTFIVGLGSIGG